MKKGRMEESIQGDLIKSVYISLTHYDRHEQLYHSLGEIERYICVNILTLRGEYKGCCGNM